MAQRSRPVWIFAAALVVLGVGIWLVQREDPREDGLRNAAAIAAPSSSADSAPRFDAAPRARLPEDAASSLSGEAWQAAVATLGSSETLAPSAVLTGRITRLTDGSPASDVSVVALVSSGGARIKAPLDEAASQALTGADGRYRLVFTGACTLDQLRAGVGPDTVRGRSEVELPLQPGTETTLDLAVGSGGALSGRVVDTHGQPIAGALVGATTDAATLNFEKSYEPDRTTTANAAGEFVLARIGPPFVITASAPGYALREQLVGTLPEGARIGALAGGAPVEPPLTVVLSPAREIRGVVLDPGGAPVPRAAIGFSLPGEAAPSQVTAAPDVYRRLAEFGGPARTGADGSFRRDHCCDEVYEVSVSAPGFLAWRGRHAPGDPDLVVRLDSGATLSGHVRAAADGAPIAEATVTLVTSDPNTRSTLTSTDFADDQGRFTFTGLHADGNAEVVVTAEGHAVFVRQPVVIAETANMPLELALDPERTLAGQVVDLSGAPVRGALVEIEGDRLVDLGPGARFPVPTWESRVESLNSASTGEDGRFRFDQLYAGNFKVTATHPRESGLIAMLTAPSGTQDLLLVLDPDATSGVTLLGRATDALTGRPVTAFDVTTMIPVGGGGMIGESHDFESADGAWRITGLQPGAMQVNADAAGYAPWSAPLQAFEAGEHVLDIRFSAARQVRLRVVNARREPLSAHLSFRNAGGPPLKVAWGQNAHTTQLGTDERGEALAVGLPAEQLTVEVRRDFLSEPQSFPLDLRTEPRGTVELVLADRGTLRVMALVLGAAPSVSTPPAGSSMEEWGPLLESLMAQGLVWPLDCDAHATVLDAARGLRAEARLDGNPSAMALAMTQRLVPQATRSIIASLEVPAGEPLTVTVEAPGYESSTQSITLDAEAKDGDGSPLLFLLRRS